MNARSLLCSTALFLSTVASAGCGDENETTAVTPSTSDAGSNECAPAPPAAKPAASCEVTIESPPVGSANHLPEGTQITYCSNPPSSGPHYPVWADFQVYDKPIEWPYLVHSMEHGSVVLLYKCDAPGCPEIVADLVKVRDNAAADPLCSAGTKRIIVAPSTTILTKVAAAAWGKTYQADCVDMPTLEAFVRDNYAKGPENICVPGRTF